MSEERIAQLETRVAELERIIGAFRAVFVGEEIADEFELDSRFGDPQIKKDPTDRFWKGPSFANKKLSECPPGYLDAFAKYKDFLATLKEKEGGADKLKYAGFDRADAARARGWAKRIRSGWKAPEKPAPSLGAYGRSSNGATTPHPLSGYGSNGRSRGYGSSNANGTPAASGGAVANGASSAGPSSSTPASAAPDDDVEFPFGANEKAPGSAPAAPIPPSTDDDEPEELL